jgi:hypothetical protein
VGFQVAQAGGDAGAALGEAGGEGFDVHRGVGRQGLDVGGQADGDQGEFRVLGEVVADHREAGGVADVLVRDAIGTRAGRGAWIRPGVGFVRFVRGNG